MAGSGKKQKKKNCFVRYCTEHKWEKNKKIKQNKHESKLLDQAASSSVREDLIGKAMLVLKCNYVNLSKIAGTLNIKRLDDIINCIYLDSAWYKERIARRISSHGRSIIKHERKRPPRFAKRRDKRNEKVQKETQE